ncbi:MAG: UDP-N-acetylmuramoylalanine--D-glutamate ligase [Deltaproteobacteria bacterium RIFCSPLOWO2_12_FULL_40_28]|nr:MAG: UDP-N-acetylmuramoylalanine--D-glutamate ligase [Deltaproteobacteria bacterium RIFCSPHIGHO2_02_FULL_40_28]OGQ19195.1 MAG: UDP-N-acetylmuramoylalanine--D-glutamate ligase [Deltaproteobacteria bacterium RIFCSPHIGHO2_12_FULL_40_32]OGQ39811.1 MAG: UDP-N-acetylmuramoylalanine--D-glutamate ligase [Deltaproteobacteria bacterium RIFCSPLOWO2_02_FULL_40_36]OGQ53647.1 MAG: UDP-N-acetylmuramoylalanine--D-glutamate ligase [Deltaproteobacteria bacterium RIFCSPLOWO2_12_FULL_40_28]
MKIKMKKKLPQFPCVIGLGKSGTDLLDFFCSQRIPCVGFEELSRENFEAALNTYASRGAKLFFKDFPKNEVKECDLFLISPGVPLTRPWLSGGIPVVGELEFASRYLDGKILAVTGTNGKSTTVTLLDFIFKNAQCTSSLKGNIGMPLISAVNEPPSSFYVVEVSSYQLETIDTFHPFIAMMLNVTEDHLDRYQTIDEYAAAKARISMNQGPGDFFIYNADDPKCIHMAKKVKSKAIPFSLVNQLPEGGFVKKNALVIRYKGIEEMYPLNECSLQGLHNQENMLAAVLAATLAGVNSQSVRQALKSFTALKHRLEYVGEFLGMKFYDDSKGTNVGSVVMSLASFEKNIILILGGKDKGGDYAPLASMIKAKVKLLLVLGEAKNKIVSALGSSTKTIKVSTMRDAIQKSFELGQKGDTVLLSPACSSFDQYKNYAERGTDFSHWVHYYGEGAS